VNVGVSRQGEVLQNLLQMQRQCRQIKKERQRCVCECAACFSHSDHHFCFLPSSLLFRQQRGAGSEEECVRAGVVRAE